ncbi:MAG TPA: alpha/beta fold hydrolase [Symbiobacteriaceae bacterium]|nr:alpha/beta fold hydrolase [Symbiobacteriaceae bacterium]
MPKTLPISLAQDSYGLAGNLVLPDGATADAPVPGAVIVGGPGPLPMQRYTPEGARGWPVLWTESLAAGGVAGLCYDQRGSGLSTGAYHDADWDALYEDACAAVEMLALQPEIKGVAAIAWGEGCAFALQLAAQGKVDAIVLMSAACHTEEERYARSIADLAARKGLSDRVVQVRVSQWKNDILATARRVQQGEVTTTVDMGGKPVTINLIRFLQTVAFDPAPVAGRVTVPALLLHGSDDNAIPPAESLALAGTLRGPVERTTYDGAAHFLYRYAEPKADAAAWLTRVLGGDSTQ